MVFIEHVLLFLKYWLENLVPRIPSKVIRAMERDRFVEVKRRENHRRRHNLGSTSSPNSPMMRDRSKRTKKSTEQQEVMRKKMVTRNNQGGMSPSLAHLAVNEVPLFLTSPLSSPTSDAPLISPPTMLESPRFLSPSNLMQLGGPEGTRRQRHWDRPEMNDIGFNDQISADYNVLESETDSESTSTSSNSRSDS